MADVADFYKKLNALVDEVIGGVIPTPPPLTKKPKKPKADAPERQVPTGAGKDVQTTGAEGEWQDVSMGDMAKYIENLNLGLSNTSPKVHDYLKIVAWVMKEHFPNEKVRITSGHRSPEKQVAIMINNWNKNGGNKKLDKPYRRKGWPKGVYAETYGDRDTMLVYGPITGKKFSQSMVTGTPSKKDWIGYYRAKIDKDKANHLSGNAIDFQSRNKPFMRDLLSKTEEYATLRIGDETKRAGPHWHIGVVSINEPKKDRLLASSNFPLTKEAFSITIEPYNYLVQKTLQEMQSKMGGDYFRYQDNNGQWVTIDKVVLESGNPGHYGMVRSNNPNTIYLSMDRIKREMEEAATPEEAEDAIRKAIIEVISHEKGHLEAHFEGGEFPAEQESKRVEPLFSTLMELGLTKEARRIRSLAYVDPSLNPNDMAQSILRIIYHFVQKVDPEKQSGYIDNLRNQLYGVDLMELSGRKKNPGAGVGGTVSITKNILGGQPPDFVNAVMQQVVQGLSKL